MVDDVVGRVEVAGWVRVEVVARVVLVDDDVVDDEVVVGVEPAGGAVDSGDTDIGSGTVVLVGAGGTAAPAGVAPTLGSGRTRR